MSRRWRRWSGYGLTATDRICSWGVEYCARLLRDCLLGTCWATGWSHSGRCSDRTAACRAEGRVRRYGGGHAEPQGRCRRTGTHPARRTPRPPTRPAPAARNQRSAAGCFRGRRLAPGNRRRPQVAACRPEGPLAPAHGRGGRSARRRAGPAAAARTDDRAAPAAMSAKHGHFASAAGSNRGSPSTTIIPSAASTARWTRTISTANTR